MSAISLQKICFVKLKLNYRQAKLRDALVSLRHDRQAARTLEVAWDRWRSLSLHHQEQEARADQAHTILSAQTYFNAWRSRWATCYAKEQYAMDLDQQRILGQSLVMWDKKFRGRKA